MTKGLTLSLGIVVAGLCACADAPVRYAPTRLPVQLPTTRLPKLLVEDVVDRTGGGEFINGEIRFPNSAMGTDVIRWGGLVSDAFIVELQRLGWPTTESRSAAGARLQVTVEKARDDLDATGWTMQHNAKLVIGVVLKNPDGRAVWSAELKGSGKGAGMSARKTWNEALNDAIPRLGTLLADEHPWELLNGKEPASANAAPSSVSGDGSASWWSENRRAAAASAATSPAPASADAPPPSDIDTLPPAGPEHPRTYAIVVGVEHYRAKLPNADFAVNDARLAAEYFKRVLGVPEANITLLTDDQATKGDFEKYFERWLPNQVQPGDVVYMYYSGHGAPNPAKGDAYLVPYDGDPAYVDQTGFAMKRLYDDLAKLPAKQVYVAIDSCFSGAGGRSVLAQGARPLVSVLPSAVPSNVTVLSASAGNQISNSYQEKGHGLFTYYLLKGLREKNGDLRAAFDYLKPEVSRRAKSEYNSEQDPQWRSGQ